MGAPSRFARFVLRTTDVVASRSFYRAVLGHDRLAILPLHEQALARGARPHLLGQIEVDDVAATAQAFAQLGATILNPLATFPDGRQFAVVRDPGGAVVGLTSVGPNPEPPLVAWHQLNTPRREQVEQTYVQLFGWQRTALVAYPDYGDFQHFAWPDARDPTSKTEPSGAFLAIDQRAEMHPAWLFYLPVADLDAAMQSVVGQGGLVLGPFVLRDGRRIAVCDDPQGAAFGLWGPAST